MLLVLLILVVLQAPIVLLVLLAIARVLFCSSAYTYDPESE
jgi:hypothetical protein